MHKGVSLGSPVLEPNAALYTTRKTSNTGIVPASRGSCPHVVCSGPAIHPLKTTTSARCQAHQQNSRPASRTEPAGFSTKGSGATTATEPRSRTSRSNSNGTSPRTMDPVTPARQGGRPFPEDAIPLTLKHRSLSCPVTGPVLESVHPGVHINTAASADGAAVLGLQLQGESKSFIDVPVGKLASGRMLACARSKLWWMTPEWRSNTRTLPPETQFLLVELRPGNQGPYALLLPLIDGDFRATLRPTANTKNGAEGELILRIESGDERVASDAWNAIMHVSVGWDPYALVERGVAAAAALSGGAAPLSAKTLPPSLDVFGWCTWDAFYSSVSAKGIQDGLTRLHEEGIRPRFLIIDDGWQLTELDPPDGHHSSPAEVMVETLSELMPDQDKQALQSTEEEFYKEKAEVLAETAQKLPASSTAATSMPLLSNLGPEAASIAQHPHHDTSDKQQHSTATGKADAKPAAPQSANGQQGGGEADAGNQAVLMARLGNKVAGWAVGFGTAAFLLAYQWLVEPAPPGSLPVRAFAALANGPLRDAMLSFYSGASDFTRRLTSVKANAKFSSPHAGPDEPWTGKPENLKQVVDHLKTKFDLDYVYCWHGLPGYWAGIMPNSPETAHLGISVMYAQPTPGVLEVEPSMAWNPAVLAGVGVCPDPAPIYNAMHSYLAGSGIDGVKVDCQAGVGLVGSALGGGPALSRRFHAALEDSIAQHFEANHAINCMCHSTENLYRMRSTAIARASDDFYPRDPASSQPHIAACAYNSVFLSALVQPDWDMFQSKHPAAQLHAIARAISGGGVYVSDKPGEHDSSLLRKLVLPDGSLLRCAAPGRPTRDCLFADVLRDNTSVLKVWNINNGGPRAPATAPPLNGVVAVLNLQGSSWDRNRRKFFVHNPKPPVLDTQVGPKDVEAFNKLPAGAANTFVAYVHGRPATSLRTVEWNGHLSLRLGPSHGLIVTFAPLMQSGELAFAAVGLMNMFNSGGAVTSVSITSPSASSGSRGGALVGVRGSGTLLMYCNRKPSSISVCNVRLLFEYRDSSGALTVEIPPTLDLMASVHVEW